MDKRAALRFPTDVEADCRSCQRAWPSRLVNVSTTGCMIVCPDEGLPEGALLRLRVKGLTAIDGELVWQHRNHAGIRFKVPLHPKVMEHLAYRGTDCHWQTESPEPRPEPELASARATARLNGALVKRSSSGQDNPELRLASAG